MNITEYYKEHGEVKPEELGLVFMIDGDMDIDYDRLEEIYRDKFWVNYKRYYKNKESWICEQYKHGTKWAKSDQKRRTEEEKARRTECNLRNEKEEKAIRFLIELETKNEATIMAFLEEYPKKLQQCRD